VPAPPWDKRIVNGIVSFCSSKCELEFEIAHPGWLLPESPTGGPIQ
jgi:hypothetical protein